MLNAEIVALLNEVTESAYGGYWGMILERLPWSKVATLHEEFKGQPDNENLDPIAGLINLRAYAAIMTKEAGPEGTALLKRVINDHTYDRHWRALLNIRLGQTFQPTDRGSAKVHFSVATSAATLAKAYEQAAVACLLLVALSINDGDEVQNNIRTLKSVLNGIPVTPTTKRYLRHARFMLAYTHWYWTNHRLTAAWHFMRTGRAGRRNEVQQVPPYIAPGWE